MEISNLSDAEFKTLVIMMLKEFREDLSSIKNTQSEMKDTLIEIKIYKETTIEWMKPRIKSMIWSKGSKKQLIRTTRRKNKKIKRRYYRQPLGQLQVF